MMVVRPADIMNFGAYEEGGVIVVGLKLRPKRPFAEAIFHIDLPESDQRQDLLGMYLEVDGRGRYNAIKTFSYDYIERKLEVGGLLESEAGPVEIYLPEGVEASLCLVERMAGVFRAYPQAS